MGSATVALWTTSGGSSDTVARGASDLYLWEQQAHPSRSGGPDLPARKLLIVSTGTTGLWAIEPESGNEVWHR